jgi:GDP-mannose 6-dehydrogenase
MKISIFGLGYVGCVTAACLAKDGHRVIGIDLNPQKMNSLKAGQSPIIEPGLEELIKEDVQSGALSVSCDANEIVCESDLSLICVGTPSNANGSLNTVFIESVCREIGSAIAIKQGFHVVVIRSTVLPGTVEEKLIPILEKFSGRKAGVDFGVCMNPEFLREGSAIQDFYHPGLVVIGELDTKSGECLQNLYRSVDAKIIRTTIRTAEMVKYTCNTFHALKVVFANEIGTFCKAQGLDGQKVMEIFTMDRQLNISDKYLMPGFAFGGSCLPKDIRAVVHRSKELDLENPLLNSILLSNQKHIESAIRLVERTGLKKVGILGLSFKANTDDLRESPTITMTETLLGRGYKIRIFDEQLQLSRLVGANKLFLEKELPHIASLLCTTMEQLIEESEVIVIANGSKSFTQVANMINQNQVLIDLTGIGRIDKDVNIKYEGICW